MKVLLDCSLLNRGGSIQVGLAVLENASRTSACKWNVVLSETMMKQMKTGTLRGFESIDVISMKTKLDRLRLLIKMPLLVDKYKPDLVFSIFGPAYWKSSVPHLQGFAHPTIIYKARFGTKVTSDRTCMTFASDPFKRMLFKRADYLVVETETVRSRLKNELGFPDERVYVIRNSYSSLFLNSIKKFSSKKSEKLFTFLVPSSYYRHKNLECVPAVASELKKITRRVFEFVFTIPETGDEWDRIKSKAEKFGVQNYIRTVGAFDHSDIGKLYRKSNAVFLPTLLECSTAVYPESFMAKIPLATSDLDFARELCGKGALYFDPTSASDMANKLFRIMSDRQLRTELVKEGGRVLGLKYPSPHQKWKEQLSCLATVLRLEKKI